jgi:hypothetical protein
MRAPSNGSVFLLARSENISCHLIRRSDEECRYTSYDVSLASSKQNGQRKQLGVRLLALHTIQQQDILTFCTVHTTLKSLSNHAIPVRSERVLIASHRIQHLCLKTRVPRLRIDRFHRASIWKPTSPGIIEVIMERLARAREAEAEAISGRSRLRQAACPFLRPAIALLHCQPQL